jgi:hypothetical protein
VCFVCQCTVLKCVGVVIIFTMYAPLTVDSSPRLRSYIVDRFVYVDIIKCEINGVEVCGS